MQTESKKSSEKSIVIVGVGLIGGSIAAAVRQRFPDCRVIGIGRNEARLKLAVERGLLTGWSTETTASTIPKGSLGIICLPVDQIANAVSQLAEAQCELITDAGSVKSSIYAGLSPESSRRFIGSHPIAGGEHTGFEHADPDLFVNRLCIITPSNAAAETVNRVAAFWKSIGMTVQEMTADDHDRILSLTSHLPHLMASVVSGCVSDDMLPFTGNGFRDTTRIAAGSASLWSAILLGNAAHCVDSITTAESRLAKFREAIRANDASSLEALLEESAQRRRKLNFE